MQDAMTFKCTVDKNVSLTLSDMILSNHLLVRVCVRTAYKLKKNEYILLKCQAKQRHIEVILTFQSSVLIGWRGGSSR